MVAGGLLSSVFGWHMPRRIKYVLHHIAWYLALMVTDAYRMMRGIP
ncbi:MAG: hypothetical protein RJA48_495 [Verrucomicrobiota bacterium]